MRSKIISALALWLLYVSSLMGATVFTIGDSTMANKNINGKERGWGMVFQSFFNDNAVTVENHAVNGRSSKSFIDEGRWQNVLDKLQPNDYVFIQFGHNDEKDYDVTLNTNPESSFREYLTRYVNETREKGAFPVLMTPIVRRWFNENGEWYDSHGEYPDAIRETAALLDVPLIDMEERSRKLVISLGAEESKKLYMVSTGVDDNTHFVEAGAIAMAQLVVEGIYECRLPLSAYLKKKFTNGESFDEAYMDADAYF